MRQVDISTAQIASCEKNLLAKLNRPTPPRNLEYFQRRSVMEVNSIIDYIDRDIVHKEVLQFIVAIVERDVI